jgi:hypothetical protein
MSPLRTCPEELGSEAISRSMKPCARCESPSTMARNQSWCDLLLPQGLRSNLRPPKGCTRLRRFGLDSFASPQAVPFRLCLLVSFCRLQLQGFQVVNFRCPLSSGALAVQLCLWPLGKQLNIMTQPIWSLQGPVSILDRLSWSAYAGQHTASHTAGLFSGRLYKDPDPARPV